MPSGFCSYWSSAWCTGSIWKYPGENAVEIRSDSCSLTVQANAVCCEAVLLIVKNTTLPCWREVSFKWRTTFRILKHAMHPRIVVIETGSIDNYGEVYAILASTLWAVLSFMNLIHIQVPIQCVSFSTWDLGIVRVLAVTVAGYANKGVSSASSDYTVTGQRSENLLGRVPWGFRPHLCPSTTTIQPSLPSLSSQLGSCLSWEICSHVSLKRLFLVKVKLTSLEHITKSLSAHIDQWCLTNTVWELSWYTI